MQYSREREEEQLQGLPRLFGDLPSPAEQAAYLKLVEETYAERKEEDYDILAGTNTGNDTTRRIVPYALPFIPNGTLNLPGLIEEATKEHIRTEFGSDSIEESSERDSRSKGVLQLRGERSLSSLATQYDDPPIPPGYMRAYIPERGMTIIYNPHIPAEMKTVEYLKRQKWYGTSAQRTTRQLTDPTLNENQQSFLRLERIISSLNAYEQQRDQNRKNAVTERPQESVQFDWSIVPIRMQQLINRRHHVERPGGSLPYPEAGFGHGNLVDSRVQRPENRTRR